MYNLVLLHIDVNTAKCIDHIGNCREIYGDKIRDIQIQVFVQHADRTGRSAEIITFGRLAVLSVCIVQVSIAVNRHQFDIFCLVVDACDQNGITVSLFVKASLSGVHTEQCNVCIAFQVDVVIDHNVTF